MVTVGIKNLKDSLSRYLKLVREGERVVVTDHNRVIAEIIPASTAATSGELLETYIKEQVASGTLFPATKKKDIKARRVEKERSTQKQIEEIYEQTRSERQ